MTSSQQKHSKRLMKLRCRRSTVALFLIAPASWLQLSFLHQRVPALLTLDANVAQTSSKAVLSGGAVPWRGGFRERSRIPRGPGILEAQLVGALFFVFLARPKSAPGPSKEMLQKEKEAQIAVSNARKLVDSIEVSNLVSGPGELDSAKVELQSAMSKLNDMRGELAASVDDLRNYPEPAYLKPHCGKKVMIAITGSSGVGKSSFINTIRRLRVSDPEAAKTGITETTKEPKMYSFPWKGPSLLRRAIEKGKDKIRAAKQSLSKLFGSDAEDEPIQIGDRVLLRNVSADLDGQIAKVVAWPLTSEWEVKLASGDIMQVRRDQVTGVLVDTVLWDLPGVGTPDHPQANYIKKMGVRHFDMVVVMTAGRFTEAELMLVDELRYWKIPFFVVKNKVDADVESEIDKEEDDLGKALDQAHIKNVEARTIKHLRDYFLKEYHMEYVYCISTRRKLIDQFDFLQLERDMESMLKKQRGLKEETLDSISVDMSD